MEKKGWPPLGQILFSKWKKKVIFSRCSFYFSKFKITYVHKDFIFLIILKQKGVYIFKFLQKLSWGKIWT